MDGDDLSFVKCRKSFPVPSEVQAQFSANTQDVRNCKDNGVIRRDRVALLSSDVISLRVRLTQAVMICNGWATCINF